MLTYELQGIQGCIARYRYLPEKSSRPGEISMNVQTGVVSGMEYSPDDPEGTFARRVIKHLKEAYGRGNFPEKGSCSWTIIPEQEEIRLVRPSMQYEQEILSFREEVLAAKDADGFAGCSWLQDYSSVPEWLDFLDLLENHPEQSGHVPSTTFLAVRPTDQRVVGIIDLRHHINHPVLSVWGGHMGYTVRPDERRKGYATQMLRLNLQKCRKRGIEWVLVTCSPENTASEKTIIANGGIFEREVLVDGEPVRRYIISILPPAACQAVD